jgi:hypothetical protein
MSFCLVLDHGASLSTLSAIGPNFLLHARLLKGLPINKSTISSNLETRCFTRLGIFDLTKGTNSSHELI